MLVHLTSPEFDLDGAVVLSVLPTSEFGETRRRTNRVATLDGGAVLNDYGYTDADRSMTLRWRPYSRELESAVVRLVKLYGQIQVSTPEGLFRAAPETYRTAANESSLVLLVLERLA
jgi:hypothetical protein